MSLSPGFSFTNCRIRHRGSASGPCRCVADSSRSRPFAPRLRRELLHALFAAFIANMAASDCCASCIIGFGCLPSRCGPGVRHAGTTRSPPRVPVLDVHASGFADTAELCCGSPLTPQQMLPSTSLTVSALRIQDSFRCSIAPPAYPAANASRTASRRPAHGSRCGVEWLAPSPRGFTPLPSTSLPGRSSDSVRG